jgi:hypothetical protein
MLEGRLWTNYGKNYDSDIHAYCIYSIGSVGGIVLLQVAQQFHHYSAYWSIGGVIVVGQLLEARTNPPLSTC